MNRQEIAEALRLCINATPENCLKCSYRYKNRAKDGVYCCDVLMADAAELLENGDRHRSVMVCRPSEDGC